METGSNIIFYSGCAFLIAYSWMDDGKKRDEAYKVGVALLLIATFLKS